MKILVGSDIHSNFIYAGYFVERINGEMPDKVVLLGDLMNYSDKNEMEKIFSKAQTDTIYSVEGNCDRYVSNFGKIRFCGENIVENLGKRTVFFTHGHIYNKYRLPSVLKEGDIICYGHTHVYAISEEEGINVANIGSIGKPRNGMRNSFAIIKDDRIEVRDVEYGDLLIEKILKD